MSDIFTLGLPTDVSTLCSGSTVVLLSLPALLFLLSKRLLKILVNEDELLLSSPRPATEELDKLPRLLLPFSAKEFKEDKKGDLCGVFCPVETLGEEFAEEGNVDLNFCAPDKGVDSCANDEKDELRCIPAGVFDALA